MQSSRRVHEQPKKMRSTKPIHRMSISLSLSCPPFSCCLVACASPSCCAASTANGSGCDREREWDRERRKKGTNKRREEGGTKKSQTHTVVTQTNTNNHTESRCFPVLGLSATHHALRVICFLRTRASFPFPRLSRVFFLLFPAAHGSLRRGTARQEGRQARRRRRSSRSAASRRTRTLTARPAPASRRTPPSSRSTLRWTAPRLR